MSLMNRTTNTKNIGSLQMKKSYIVFALAGLLSAVPLWAQESYDLVLKGGHVIDPKNKVDGVMDVGIRDHKIAAVAPSIAASADTKIVNVSGLYVTPGLVDIHVHV